MRCKTYAVGILVTNAAINVKKIAQLAGFVLYHSFAERWKINNHYAVSFTTLWTAMVIKKQE